LACVCRVMVDIPMPWIGRPWALPPRELLMVGLVIKVVK